MKLLMENWRKYLLTEAAMTVDDLMGEKTVDLYIMARPSFGEGIEFVYASTDRRGEPYALDYPKHSVTGEIVITPAGSEEIDGPCDNAWQVKYSSAVDKWGPLLYDVAMEYATMNGNGLIADREEVSGHARAVWDYYLNRRGDVDNHQLDNIASVLTPEIEVDNCAQDIAATTDQAVDVGFNPPMDAYEGNWVDSPLSKRYTKQPTTLNKLIELGRFIDKT